MTNKDLFIHLLKEPFGLSLELNLEISCSIHTLFTVFTLVSFKGFNLYNEMFFKPTAYVRKH